MTSRATEAGAGGRSWEVRVSGEDTCLTLRVCVATPVTLGTDPATGTILLLPSTPPALPSTGDTSQLLNQTYILIIFDQERCGGMVEARILQRCRLQQRQTGARERRIL